MQDAGGTVLQFDQEITWRAGKPIAVSELLRRLETLHAELASLDQEDADRESLVPVAQHLANQQLLQHKDKGIKAWSMACIVEMFRLLAPDAPYKQGQLRTIFDIFISTIVPALADTSDPYNQQHLLVLNSLTTIKSIVLLADLSGADNLILTLFANCFDVLSGTKRSHGEQLPKNLEYYMTNMLQLLIDEATSLPAGVVEIILAQFLRYDPRMLSGPGKNAEPPAIREISPAHNMARSVCNACADKMSRHVGQYFGTVLIDASEAVATRKGASRSRGKKRTHDESEDESEDGLLTPPAEDDLREVEKAHRLLRELWRSSPNVIQNIIPQMEAEIAAENAELRTMAVQTIGDMIAGIGAAGPPAPIPLDPAAYPSQSLQSPSSQSQVDNVLLAPAAPHVFSSIYPTAYQSFVDRHRDRYPGVRSAWATAVGRVILTSGGGKGLDSEHEKVLLRYFADLLVDNDERVRLAAIQAVAAFDFDSLVQKLGSSGGVNTAGSVWYNLADRIKDRKHHVRIAAMELLGRVWGVAAGAIAEGRERVRELFGDIPTRILSAVYVNNPELSALVHRVLFDSLLPIGYPPIRPRQADSQRVIDSQAPEDTTEDPDALRTERILVLVGGLEKKAKDVFFAFQQQQTQRAKLFNAFVDTCAKLYNGKDNASEEDDRALRKKLDAYVEILARGMPESNVVKDHLKKFGKHNDRRAFQLVKFCLSPESDYRKIVRAMKELIKRMEEAPSSMLGVMDSLMPLVRSASVLVYNRSHVPTVMRIARTDEGGMGHVAQELLKQISTKAPDVFKVHVKELCEVLKRQVPTAATPNDPTAVDTLKACAGFAKRFPDDMPRDREFYQAMTAFALYGSPPEAAKHAVTVFTSAAGKREMYISQTLKGCLQDFEYGSEGFLARLASLSQLRLKASHEVEAESDAILDIAVSKILGGVRTEADDDGPSWQNEIDDDLCSKLWALRVLVNGVRGVARGIDKSRELQESMEAIEGIAQPVYKLLNTLIVREGELSKTTTTSKAHCAHMRLAAANLLLKLSCDRVTDQLLTPRDFNNLARITQDAQYEVRAGFLATLKKYLAANKLPNRFYGLVFLYAYEPTKTLLESTTTWLKSRAAISSKANDKIMLHVLPRFLSLLAHHQDFSTSVRDLGEFVEYITFYLKTVASQDNLPVIYSNAQRLKTVQDGIDPSRSENLYAISDLAEAVIRIFQDHHSWSLQIDPNKPRLPVGIFALGLGRAEAQEIAEKRFLPDELVDKLEDLVKDSLRPRKRKAEGSAPGNPPKKAKVKTEAKKPVARAKATAKTPKKRKLSGTALPSSDRRKSTRGSKVQNYIEDDSSAEDEELEKWQGGDDDDDVSEVAEQRTSSTPPTSDPTPGLEEEEEEEQQKENKVVIAKTTGAKRKKTVPVARKVAARPARKAKKTKDTFDVPSDSDEELSDAPDDVGV